MGIYTTIVRLHKDKKFKKRNLVKTISDPQSIRITNKNRKPDVMNFDSIQSD